MVSTQDINENISYCIIYLRHFKIQEQLPVLNIWAFFSKVRRTFRARKASSHLHSTCFEKVIFEHDFYVRKTKRIAKFDGLEPRHCEYIKGIVEPEKAIKVSGLAKNRPQAPVQSLQKITCSFYKICFFYAVCVMDQICSYYRLNP